MKIASFLHVIYINDSLDDINVLRTTINVPPTTVDVSRSTKTIVLENVV